MATKYLDKTGLAYFWGKIKSWVTSRGYITSSGSITGNAATATRLGTSTVGSSVQPIYLESGTATAVNSALKTCYGGVESEAVSNTYFKIGSGSITKTYNHLKVKILVQHLTSGNSCIWDIWLCTGRTAGGYSQGHSILFNSTGYYGANLIVAYKSNSGGSLDFELYVKETARYSNHRFTVIQECWRNEQKVGNILTLYNQLTTTGTSTITSGYTALTTTVGTVNMNINGSSTSCSGNAATAFAVAWSGVTGKPTTIDGYGITDAKIANGTITLGSNSITPLTSVPSHNQASNTINAMTDYSKPDSTSAIAATDSLNAAVGKLEKALDGKAASEHSHADYVDLTTDQYIDGTKTFIESVIMSHNSISAGFVVKQRGITRGGTWENQSGTFVFRDNDNNALAEMRNYTYTNSNNVKFNQLLFILYNPGSTSSSDICGLLFDAGGWTSFIFSPSGSDDNKVYLGASNRRWKQLYAATATINTSDERCKDSITDIPDEVLDAWGNVRWRQFRFTDAVEKKGSAARLHSGTVAQDMQRIFAAAGLDVSRYGFFCHDRWDSEPEQLDENGRVVRDALEAGDRYSLRYEELLCIEAAYQRRRADRLEARIAEIEARLTAMEAANGY